MNLFACANLAAVYVMASANGHANGLPSADPSSLRHVRFGAADGLPPGAVTTLRQLRSGHLALAVGNQVALFDGVEFRTLPGLDFPAHAQIESLEEDKEGALWIGGKQLEGFWRWKDGVASRFGVETGLPSPAVRELCVDTSGTLWVGTVAGLARRRDQGFETLDLGPMPSRQVRTMGCAPDGAVWVAHDEGPLRRLEHGRSVPFAGEREVASLRVRRAFPARDGTLWLGTMDGRLAQLAAGSLRVFGPLPGFDGRRLKDIAEDPQGGLWLGGFTGGLVRFDGDRFEPLREARELGLEGLSALIVDHEGNPWVAATTGLVQLRRRPFKTLSVREGLRSGLVSAMAQKRDGSVLIATAMGITCVRDGGFVDNDCVENVPIPARITALAVDAEGALVVGTERGLGRAVSGTFQPAGPPEIQKDKVNALLVDHTGAIWVAVARGVFVQGADGGTIEIGKAQGLPMGPGGPTALVQDSAGNVWIAGSGGLARIDRGRVVQVVALLGGPRVSALVAVPRAGGAALMVGTDNGLFVSRMGRLRRFGPAEGIPAIVGAVIDDGFGNVWIGTRQGLLRIPIDVLMSNNAMPPEPLRLGVEDGLYTADFSVSAAPGVLRTQAGHLWFLSEGEVVIVNPKAVFPNRLPPPVSIDAVIPNGDDSNPGLKSVFAAGTTQVELRFAALSFRAPLRNRYRYRMLGVSPEWVDGGHRRSVVYARLGPGDYSFELRAANADGVWNVDGARVTFRILPLLSERVSVRAAAVLGLAALLAMGIYAVRIGRIRARYAAVTADRNRIARELHDTVEQGLTSLSLHLKAVSARIGQPGEAARHLADTFPIVAHIQDDVRHHVWDLRGRGETHVDLPTALAALGRQAGDLFVVDVKVHGTQRSLGRDVETALLRVAQSAMANVVRHARASHAWVTLVFDDQSVRLEVRDDGRGFVVPPAGPGGQASIGLVGMSERMRLVGGILKVDSLLGQGTTVTATTTVETGATA